MNYFKKLTNVFAPDDIDVDCECSCHEAIDVLEEPVLVMEDDE